MEKFINSIIKNLEANGYPENKVSLPLEKMYEIADEKGLNFNTVLKELETQGISHTKETEKIIFSKNDLPDFSNLEEMMKNQDPGNMMKMAQEFLAKMSPEQRQEIQEKVMNMDPKEREELMGKAKDMGVL